MRPRHIFDVDVDLVQSSWVSVWNKLFTYGPLRGLFFWWWPLLCPGRSFLRAVGFLPFHSRVGLDYRTESGPGERDSDRLVCFSSHNGPWRRCRDLHDRQVSLAGGSADGPPRP